MSRATARGVPAGLALPLVALLAAADGRSRAGAPAPPKCDLDAGEDCCKALPATRLSCDPAAPAGRRSPRRKSILVIVGDDNGYCHHGFMQGMCTESSLAPCPEGTCADPREICTRGRCFKPCVSNLACSGTCADSDTVAAALPPDERPLRLAEPTCRSRQPPRPTKRAAGWCAAPTDESGSFAFGLRFPCPGTPPDQDFAVRTPYLDALASEGAVFPRAHVPGNSCKPARAAILLGLANRHMPNLARSDRRCNLADASGYNAVACHLPGHKAYLWGKGEVANEEQAGFTGGDQGPNPSLGDLGRCEAENCAGRIRRLLMPVDVPDGVVPPPDSRIKVSGIETKIFRRIEIDLMAADDDRGRNSRLTRPFLVWYAPNMPHLGGRVPEVFATMYDPRASDPAALPREALSRDHLARVSLFDLGVGALIDGLKRRCVCDADGKEASLWDNTVVLFLNDQGVFLPAAKFTDHDNGHRTPLVVNEPGHRLPGADRVRPHVFSSELANGIDLLGTIASYASEPLAPPLAAADPAWCGPAPEQFAYPFDRNLCPAIKDPTAGPLRRLQYGHSVDDPFESNLDHYVVTRPGELGVCGIAPGPGLHLRPCRRGRHDQCGAGDRCHTGLGTCGTDGRACVRDRDCGATAGSCRPPADGGGGRCANRPARRCGIDVHCADPSWCDATRCTTRGDWVEFHGKPCTAASDCMPRGACQELVLKLESGGATRLWDLNWDPDQTTDLLGAASPSRASYAGSAVVAELETCADAFFDLGRDATTLRWQPPRGCPFEP